MNKEEVFSYIARNWEASDEAVYFFQNNNRNMDCIEKYGCKCCRLNDEHNFNGGCLTDFKDGYATEFKEAYPELFL